MHGLDPHQGRRVQTLLPTGDGKEHIRLAGLTSDREHPHARKSTSKQNVLLGGGGVTELTRCPWTRQRSQVSPTYTHAHKSHQNSHRQSRVRNRDGKGGVASPLHPAAPNATKEKGNKKEGRVSRRTQEKENLARVQINRKGK